MLEWGSHVRAPSIHPVWCVYDWPALQVEAVASYTFIWTAHHMTCVCVMQEKNSNVPKQTDRSQNRMDLHVSRTHTHQHTQRLGKFVWECSQILNVWLQHWTLIHRVTQRVCGGVDLEVHSGNTQMKNFIERLRFHINFPVPSYVWVSTFSSFVSLKEF